MTFSIRRKLFVLLAGFTAAVLTGVLTQVTSSLSAAILAKVKYDFRQTQRTFQREQALRYNSLLDAATLIGENPAFKANVSLGDPASVYVAVQDLARFTRVELFLVTDARGRLLAQYGDPERHGQDLGERASVARALRGEERQDTADLSQTWPELWLTAQDLYQVASVPVWLNDDTIIGTLTLGASLSKTGARDLKGESQIDVTFLADGRLVDTTVEGLTPADLDAFQQAAPARVGQVVPDLKTSDVFEERFAGEEVFAFLSPLGFGEPAYYVATARKSRELQLLAELRDNIFLAGGLSLLITVFLALVLGRQLTQPILRLVGGMNLVKAGDLSVRLQATTHDEVGLLTSTFNDMIGGLRERLQLVKYVGSHTLDMIRQTDGDVPLGGSRHDLAVLFTDIRGFTTYSEKRDPEEVISMLNRYLGFQADIVPRHEGSVDKFVGDEMMAIFIGPAALDNAVACAVEIQKRVEAEHATDAVPIHIGMGINYGPATLGNMGAQSRLDYTAIGATVNLGARLMQVAQPGQILIPQALLARLQTPVTVCRAQAMAFKGISEPLAVAQIWEEGSPPPFAPIAAEGARHG